MCQHNFAGTMFVGYRGALPTWASSAIAQDGVSYLDVAPDCHICFVPVETTLHLANYKPFFMETVFDHYLSPEDNLCYFDPDIVIKCQWRFIEEWVQNGLAIVEDCGFPYMPEDHPLRFGWMRVARENGLTKSRSVDRYYNSGFVGVPWRYKHILNEWKQCLYFAEKAGYVLQKFNNIDRTTLWQAADQDVLNMLVMTTEVPLTTLGPDGMDFASSGYVLSHAATSTPKPWGKNYVKAALQGIRPTFADKAFWANVEHPIRIYPASVVRARRAALLFAIALGRFYHR